MPKTHITQATVSHNAQQNNAPAEPARAANTAAERKPLRATVAELLPYLFAQRLLLTIALTFGILASVTALLQPVLVGKIIELVGANAHLGIFVPLLVGCVLASAVFSGLQHYTLQRMGENVVLRSRRTLISKLLYLPISQFDQRRTGDLVSRIASDTTLLRAVLTQGLVEALAGSLVLVGSLIGMLLLDPVLFFATGSVLVAALIIVVLISLRMRPLVTQTQQQVGDLAASVDRAIGAIRTIRAAGATDTEAAAVTAEAKKAYRLGLKVAKLSAFIVPISFIALQLCFLVVLGLGGLRVASGALAVSQLVTFVIFVFLLITPLGSVFGAVSAVNQALGALGRIQELARLETETEIDAAAFAAADATPVSLEQVPNHPIAIEFVDVHFAYRSAAPERVDARKLVSGRRNAEYIPPQLIETKVLHGVSFQVPRGKRVALVGPSGAGKSTIFGLIERFNDPQQGTVLYNGVDVRMLERAQLRTQFGYVEQDAPVLAGSIRDNLLLSAPHASDADCVRALQLVNLQALLERAAQQVARHRGLSATVAVFEDAGAAVSAQTNLALGLDAAVGEDGVLLSGGEKQRLAIARALLADAPVLLLDESTANLDAVNEALMRDALAVAAGERTMLIIAHRLATVADSDLIIVLEDGQVVAQGTHEQLLETSELYREMARRQLLADS